MDPQHPLPLLIFFLICTYISSSASLSTVSISKTSNQILICALVPSHDNQRQSFLRCTSFRNGTQNPITTSHINSISAITAGNGFQCILRAPSNSLSVLRCKRFSGNGTDVPYKRIYRGPMLQELDAGNSHICGRVMGTNRLECWQWREFDRSVGHNLSGIAVGGEFVCGLLESGNITCLGDDTSIVNYKPDGNFSVVAAGDRHACAISLNGKVECWGQRVQVMGKIPEEEFVSLALGDGRSCGVRRNGTVVCWGEDDFKLPESLAETEFMTIQGKGNVFCGIVKGNYSLFCWGNEIFDTNSTVFDRVLPGPCRRRTACTEILPGSGSLCNNGFICQLDCGRPVPNGSPPALPPAPTGSTHSNGGDKKRVAFIVVGCVGTVTFAISLCFLLFRYCKERRCRVHDSGRLDEAEAIPQNQRQRTTRPVPPSLDKRLSQLVSMGHSSKLEEFTFQVLLQATDNFSEDYKIGYGSFGSVYRATLEDGREVAIKRAELTASSNPVCTKRQDDQENAFLSELAFLSRVNHKNLVRLLGYCEDGNERVLVYEYMPNGTLHDHLHKLENSPLMSWLERLKVALDAARGIEYLHTYAVPPIIHRDIKSSNILLDATWMAKVSDFGLSLMGPDDEESHLSLRAAGTVGYMDPEYYRLQQLTTKSDVYSFGVVLLELLSGYRAIHPQENGVPRNVVDFVKPYIVTDEMHHVLDPKLPPPTPSEIEAVAHVAYLAADCVNLEGRDRPSMTDIVYSLERALTACVAPPPSPSVLSRSTTGSSHVCHCSHPPP